MNIREEKPPSVKKYSFARIKNSVLFFGEELKSDIKLDLVNLSGEVVRSVNASRLPLEPFAAGIYVAVLWHNHRIVQTARIIIQ